MFLDALRRVASRRPIRGYIIGGPIYDTSNSQFSRHDLQTMIDSRELGGCVGLTGRVESAPAMRALDIIVHASTAPEPFGLAIAEAMACGKAVITTGFGGAAELISNEHDALVAAAGDAAALAGAIRDSQMIWRSAPRSANALERRRAFDSRQRPWQHNWRRCLK